MTTPVDRLTDGDPGTTTQISETPPSQLVRRIARRAEPGTPPQQANDHAMALLTSAPIQLFAHASRGGYGRLALTEVAGIAVVDGLFVPPEARRHGVATALIKTLAFAAQARGASTIALEVEADNVPAVTCYRRLGFSTAHSHRYFTAEPGQPQRSQHQ